MSPNTHHYPVKKLLTLLYVVLALAHVCCTGGYNASKKKKAGSTLDPKGHEVLATKHNAMVENFYILVKSPAVDSVALSTFVKKFRKENCDKCNIKLYDDPCVIPLMLQYPLKKEEYELLADHFVASSTFDSNAVYLFPLK
ncbi:hypothetical protein CLV24_1402 [Pontibacter ummariensis]|uniref:Uncharacterized protein n=1 Tax=Pontibacter ummariensis TaxID=1610492 RepID=A0A239LF67_9BACT|nr:hypothetical protein [Pontibacter ummariensis]PRY03626.1 hypothetical protein CLV24_1402 [Pontibacter ummariensis]SNT28592.1 hypothetical protein SAMN06296052_1402 [Pontibacter ummariensis]